MLSLKHKAVLKARGCGLALLLIRHELFPSFARQWDLHLFVAGLFMLDFFLMKIS